MIVGEDLVMGDGQLDAKEKQVQPIVKPNVKETMVPS